jgi:hypothetical protein
MLLFKYNNVKIMHSISMGGIERPTTMMTATPAIKTFRKFASFYYSHVVAKSEIVSFACFL